MNASQRPLTLILTAALFVAAGAVRVLAEPRNALLIGAWKYTDATFSPLPEKGIQMDLQLMQSRLTSVGFKVKVLANPGLKEAKQAVDDFGALIRSERGTSLFYFSGHGSEFDGKNFLIPVGTSIRSNRDLDTEALAADRVLSRMEESGGQVNIVFLDCCRNAMAKSAGGGLAAMEARGTFIGYATSSTKLSGATQDGSFYTRVLAEQLGQSGLSITDMHTLVTKRVKQLDPTQVPHQYSGLDDLFYFKPASPSTDTVTGGTGTPPVVMNDPKAETLPVPPPSTEINLGGGMARTDVPKLEVIPLHDSNGGQADDHTNSLGMKFVRVPELDVMFCIHETRVVDFSAFLSESGYDYNSGGQAMTMDIDGLQYRPGASWRNPGFAQTEQHPVTCVSWEDARAFCQWLSKKEGRSYRLPRDHEWSVAAGLGRYERPTDAPYQKDAKIAGVYPWGGAFPPQATSGNYAGEEARTATWSTVYNFPTLFTHRDSYPRTAPVMKFPPNSLGLYDMGGNVWEWCEEWFDKSKQVSRVARGGSWMAGEEVLLRTSVRLEEPPKNRVSSHGFRLVLDLR